MDSLHIVIESKATWDSWPKANAYAQHITSFICIILIESTQSFILVEQQHDFSCYIFVQWLIPASHNGQMWYFHLCHNKLCTSRTSQEEIAPALIC